MGFSNKHVVFYDWAHNLPKVKPERFVWKNINSAPRVVVTG